MAKKNSKTVIPTEDNAKPNAATVVRGTSKMKRLNSQRFEKNRAMRLRVGHFMQLLGVELFFIGLVLIYGGMVFVQLTLDAETLKKIATELNVLDLVLGSALLVEIALKLYAFGRVYLANCWNMFDGCVVVVSFVLSIVATFGPESQLLVAVLRFRVILRLFRVLVVFERVKSKTKAHRFAGDIEVPLEHVIRILNELKVHPGLHPRIHREIEYAEDIIKTNRLYDTGGELLDDKTIDADTQMWLRGEVMRSQNGNNALQKVVPERGHHNVEHGTHMHRSSTEQVLMPLDTEQGKLLDSLLLVANTWHFDVFKADSVTNGNALSHIGMHFFQARGLHHCLKTNVSIISNYFVLVQGNYKKANTYHNAIHGADVMQSVNYFLTKASIDQFLTPLDHASSLLAAAVHDLGHDGLNNAYQIAIQSELAVRYNDVSVFENYHIAQAFTLMRSSPDVNVLERLDSDDTKYVRSMMIELVLGTDMSKHFEDVALFKTKIVPAVGEEFKLESLGDKRLLLKLILHTSDVSNPAKERSLMLKWTHRVVEEFFAQGDMERDRGLPVSPFMDRNNCTLMKQQLGFIDYIVNPLFELWSIIVDDIKHDGLAMLSQNKQFWKDQGESFTPDGIPKVLQELTGEVQPANFGIIPEDSVVEATL